MEHKSHEERRGGFACRKIGRCMMCVRNFIGLFGGFVESAEVLSRESPGWKLDQTKFTI